MNTDPRQTPRTTPATPQPKREQPALATPSQPAQASPVTTTSSQPSSPAKMQTPDALLRQGVQQDELRALQEGIVNPSHEVLANIQPSYPTWPTSVPGPLATPPPPGMRPINAIRPEQVVEVGYNQETGEPATQDPHRSLPDASQGPMSFDLPTAQDAIRRGKVRLD